MSNIFYLKKIKLRFQRELFFLLSGKRAIFQIFAYLFQISGEDFHIFFCETGPELVIYISQKMPEGLCLSAPFFGKADQKRAPAGRIRFPFQIAGAGQFIQVPGNRSFIHTAPVSQFFLGDAVLCVQGV